MITIRLLKITDDEHEEFDEFFDETEQIALDQVAPQVVDGVGDVMVGDKSISEYDAVFAEIPEKNAVFGRVLLEMIGDQNVAVNYPSTAFFIMAKKNYLYYVLHEKEIPSPKTASVATEKAARNIHNYLKGPLIARRLEDLEETEAKKLDSVEDITGFAEGSEYEEDIMLFHEFNSGDRYRCLVVGDQIVSLKDDSEGWKFTDDSLNYSNISDTQEGIVREAASKIGTDYAEVLLRGEQVFDINPNPDLRMYTEIGGKNAHEAVASVLKEEIEG
ncbi:MAG: RimK family alpha-L-glutamate ligase [Candidatus Nanohaloarchaea archaeon]